MRLTTLGGVVDLARSDKLRVSSANQQTVAFLVSDLAVQEGQRLSALDGPGVDDNLVVLPRSLQESDVQVHRHASFEILDIVGDQSVSRDAIDESAGETAVETASLV